MSPEVEEAIRNAAERADLTVSAWLARAAEHVAKIEDGLAAMAEWEAEYGPISPEERRQARQALIEDGVIPPEELKEAC
ncbi:MAG TPA: hypothetical protein VFX70_09600 [Mycobacteriales bacterium]|nr:hypothetical protein [Mycobacteriales bacterium]